MFPKVSVKTMGAVIPLSWGNAQVLRSIWISMKNLFFSHLCVEKGLSKLRMSLAGGRAGESKQWSDIRLVTASRCAGAFLYRHLRSSSRPLSSMLTSFRCQRSIEEPCRRYVWELGWSEEPTTTLVISFQWSLPNVFHLFYCVKKAKKDLKLVSWDMKLLPITAKGVSI